MKHARRRLIRLTACIALLSFYATSAHAAGSGMPWEAPLQQVVDSLTGPVARAAGVVAIVVAGMGIMFTEGGSGIRKLAFVGLGVAVMFAAATWGLTLFGFAGGAVL
ncbi:MAG: TrbC/VirB2 family protein [Terricaulis sp.]